MIHGCGIGLDIRLLGYEIHGHEPRPRTKLEMGQNIVHAYIYIYILGPLDLGIHYSVTSYHLFIENAYSYLFAAV